ncbi:Sir2 family NAD+-dependent deacetylase [Pseudomonas sp. C27(2019)]|uniref:Sir2 family NAD+-dependent deacetylase n=1 Tax=Pseudomonas sp. C27(2019) TaxID=2604941 RepID=UPI001C49B89F|nr:Sir2 family NAD+-dependent deacetylase [Pseudomonas sp. C27(2019)]
MQKSQPKNIVILTGAGISADSGIATFRASDGLWEKHNIEEVATPEGYARNPELVQRFYNERRAQLLDPKIKPNRAHSALAELEAHYQNKGIGSVTIVTQNIDDLHQRAGSKNVMHMHGELLKLRCVKTQQVVEWRSAKPVTNADRCQCCTSPQALRPHIVWFGEMPFYMDEIHYKLSRADLFVAIGTSGHVYPAAGFVANARSLGLPTLELNLEASQNASQFTDSIYGRATDTVPQWVHSLICS